MKSIREKSKTRERHPPSIQIISTSLLHNDDVDVNNHLDAFLKTRSVAEPSANSYCSVSAFV